MVGSLGLGASGSVITYTHAHTSYSLKHLSTCMQQRTSPQWLATLTRVYRSLVRPPIFTVGGLAAADGFTSPPLLMCLGPKLTLMLTVGTKRSTTSPITLPTTKGSTKLAIVERERERERERDGEALGVLRLEVLLGESIYRGEFVLSRWAHVCHVEGSREGILGSFHYVDGCGHRR